MTGEATAEDRPRTGTGSAGTCREAAGGASEQPACGGTAGAAGSTGAAGTAGAGDGPPEAADAAAPGRARGRDHLLPAPVAVSWNQRQRRPVSFVWRRRRYRVERVLETWVLETGWWKDDGHVSRLYWRVRAEGRVFDLRYDRLTRAWALERALN